MSRNLLKETHEILKRHERLVSDVHWVGVKDRWSTSWATFATAAKDLTYDAGFGGNEVHNSLVVVGDDWWLERHEYDGSEWWEFKTLPGQPVPAKKAKTKVDAKALMDPYW